MRLLFDTSAYSAFMRGHERIRRAVRANEEIFLNSIVIGEITAGFIKGSRRKKAEVRRFLASPRVGRLDVSDRNGIWVERSLSENSSNNGRLFRRRLDSSSV